MQLTLEIPEKFTFFQAPEELAKTLKLNTAINLYRNGRLSASAAAEFVGQLDRYEFLYECHKQGVEPQTYENIEELQDEIDRLDALLL